MAEGEVKITIDGDDSGIQKKLDDTKEGFDSLDEKLKDSQKETDNAKSKFEELADSLAKQEKELTSLKGAYTEAVINFGKGSAEAKELESKITSLNDELHKNKEAFSQAKNAAKELTPALEENEKSFGAADVAIGTFISNGISSLISKAGEAVGSIVALADETREYREDMAKLDTAFTEAGHSTETAQQAYDGFYKLLGESDRSVEAVNHLAELTSNTEELSQWQTIAAGVTAKFGDSLPIEGLTEAANETAKVGAVTGPFADALNWASAESSVFGDALGGNQNALAAFNKAIAEGANVEDAFSAALGEMSTEQERSSAITATLNGLYSEAGNKYNEMTASQQAARDATNKLEQAQANLGGIIEPLTTAWTNLKANALEWFISTGLPALQTGWQWIKDNLPLIAVVVGGLTAAWLAFGGAQTLLNAVQTAGIAIQTALNVVMNANPIGLIILAITALVAGFMLLWENCEGFRNFWIGLWENIKVVLEPVIEWIKQAFSVAWEAIKSAWDTVQPYFAALWEGIKAVFAVVKAVLGAYFSAAWEAIKVVWDLAKSYFSIVWEGIKAVFSVVKEWFSGMFKTAWEAIKVIWDAVTGYFKQIWETIKGIFAVVKAVLSGNWKEAWEAIKGIVAGWASYFSGVWEGIKNVFSAVGSWFSNTFSAAWEGIKSVWSAVKTFFSEKWNDIKSVFSNAFDSFLTIGKNIVDGIKQGIKNAWNNLKEWFSGLFGDLTSIAKKILGIESPSKVMRDEVGVWILPGIAEGIEQTKDVLVKALNGAFNAMVDYLNAENEKQIKTIADFNAEKEAEYDAHAKALEQIESDKNKSIAALNEKLAEDKKKKDADVVKLEKEYNKDLADIHQKAYNDEQKQFQTHGNNMRAINDNIRKNISDKMTALLSLEADYNSNVKKLWDDLETSIDDLNKKYDEQLKSRTESIANSLNLWNAAEKNKVNGSQLQKNLKSQVNVLKNYNTAIEKLEGRGINEEFVQQLKEMGVGATGEIEALARMTDDELNDYVALWEEKNALAHDAALEELEPLKADTIAEIKDLSDKALVEYHRLTENYRKESVILVEELKTAMEESGLAGYEEIMSQVDDYILAGASLLDGVITGIAERSPYLQAAVEEALNRAIASGEAIAGISVPVHTDESFSLEEYMANLGGQITDGVNAESAKIASGGGVSRSTADAELISAVGQSNANLGSLASAFNGQTKAAVTVPINIDGREFGRAVVEFGTQESNRTGTSLAFT